jgi:flagellar hook-associated protein 2
MTSPINSPSSTLSGLSSGLDWRTIVDRIIQVEQRPTAQLRDRLTKANDRTTAWGSVSKLADAVRTSLKNLADGSALKSVSATVTTTGTGGTQPLAAAATLGAEPGRYQAEVLQVAQADKLGGTPFASSNTALGLSGELWVNGARVSVTATDALSAVRDKINAANTGAAATKVTATLLQTASGETRLLLTSDVPGVAGVNLSEGPTGVVAGLGFTDGTTAIKNPNSAGANSDRFSSATTNVKTLLGLTAASGPTVVTLGGQNLTVDLSTEGLTTIAANVNTLVGVTASVQSATTDGVTRYWLDVRGTTNLGDSGHVLEMLGLLKGGHAPVAQAVRGGVLTAGDAVTPATSATLLSNLWNGSAAANVLVGDTLTVTGLRGDGTAVNLTYTVAGGDTVQTLLTRLNSAADGFGAGTRPATASMDGQGRITLTDGTTGDSRLAVGIVTHNEGGGRLDLGSFSTAVAGRLRTMTTGADAIFRVDGVTLTRSSNAVTDAIPGLTLSLLEANPGKVVTIDVVRSSGDAVQAVNGFVKAFNELADFIAAQRSVDPSTTQQHPLFADSGLSQVRGTLAGTLLSAVNGTPADLSTAAAVGLSISKGGKLSLDQAKFTKALADRFGDVKTLLASLGTVTDPEVTFGGYGPRTQVGTYGVVITTPAARGTVAGAGFGGGYVDDATPDLMRVTDTASGAVAQVSLANGMTTSQIVQALTDAFALKVAQKIQTGTQQFSDAGGTVPVTTATTWANVRGAGGAATNVAAGDTITFSGTRGDGTTFDGTYTISNPATGTMSDLVARLQKDFGPSVTVSVPGGRIVVEQRTPGPSQLNLIINAQNQGLGSLSFGGVTQVALGRNALGITAAAQGADVVLTHATYGSAAGFSVAYLPGGTDGTAQLGIGAGGHAGADVGGTIGGFTATGIGQQLAGNTGMPVEGLAVAYSGTTARAAGDVSVSLGLGALLTRSLDAWLDTTGGLFTVKEAGVSAEAATLNGRITAGDTRLAQRRAALIAQFTKMEQSISRIRSQQSSLSQLLGTTVGG